MGGGNELETEYMGQDSVHEVKGTEAYTGEKGEEIKKLRECTLQHFIKALWHCIVPQWGLWLPVLSQVSFPGIPSPGCQPSGTHAFSWPTVNLHWVPPSLAAPAFRFLQTREAHQSTHPKAHMASSPKLSVMFCSSSILEVGGNEGDIQVWFS